MSLAIRSTHANIQLPQGTDRLGKLLLAALDRWTMDYLVDGNGWRIHGWCDGGSAFSNTLDNNGFTGNGGKGYLDTGTLWSASAVANTITRPKAGFRIKEYVAGVATGREVMFQRGSLATDNGENNLTCVMSVTGFTGSFSGAAVPTGGTFEYLTDSASSVLNGVGRQVGGSNVNINDAVTLVGQVLSSPVPVNGVLPIGIMCWNKTTSAVRWLFTIEAINQPAAADPHPFLAWCDTWSILVGGPAVDTASQIFTPTSPRAWSVVSGTWTRTSLASYHMPGNARHPDATGVTMLSNADSKFAAMPAYVTPELANTTRIKGRLDSIRVHFPQSTAHLPPATYGCLTPVAGELPRFSAGHVTYLAYDGFIPDWSGAADRTDLVTLDANYVAETPDTTPPTVTLISPVSLEDIADDQAITLEFDDDVGIEFYVIFACFPDLDLYELVVDGADLALETAYTRTPTTVDGKQRWTFVRAGGWPQKSGVAVEGFIRARAIDGGGNVS